MQSMYDPQAVAPMEEELVNVGFQALKTPEDVDAVFAHKEGTTLLFVNSVCGCSAGAARPGVSLALQHRVIPDRIVTVFAGVDREAVQRAREQMPGVAPSSPFIALFKDGELVGAMPRGEIEMLDARAIADNLLSAFDRFCHAPGPSVSPEVFERTVRVNACGSSIPQVWFT